MGCDLGRLKWPFFPDLSRVIVVSYTEGNPHFRTSHSYISNKQHCSPETLSQPLLSFKRKASIDSTRITYIVRFVSKSLISHRNKKCVCYRLKLQYIYLYLPKLIFFNPPLALIGCVNVQRAFIMWLITHDYYNNVLILLNSLLCILLTTI